MISSVAFIMLGLLFLSAWIFTVSEGVWLKIMAFSSLSIKGAVLILLMSAITGDLSITVVALAALILGNLGVMVLAIVMERRNPL